MQADNLHPIEAGAEARARLIAEGVLGCLAGAAGADVSQTPPESRTPVLKSAPAQIPQVDALQRRQEAILRIVFTRVLPGAAAMALLG